METHLMKNDRAINTYVFRKTLYASHLVRNSFLAQYYFYYRLIWRLFVSGNNEIQMSLTNIMARQKSERKSLGSCCKNTMPATYPEI